MPPDPPRRARRFAPRSRRFAPKLAPPGLNIFLRHWLAPWFKMVAENPTAISALCNIFVSMASKAIMLASLPMFWILNNPIRPYVIIQGEICMIKFTQKGKKSKNNSFFASFLLKFPLKLLYPLVYLYFLVFHTNSMYTDIKITS